jgi:O-antigen ligase
MLVIPFCIGFAAWARDIFTRRLAKAVLVLASVALILTQSRGGLLAYVGVLVACAWFLAPNPKARRRYVALILVFSIAGGAVLGLMFARLAGVDAFTEASRLAVWAGSAAVFSGSPIAGIGYGNLRSVLAEKIGVSESYMLDAHNLYLELLAETGILGLVAFAILVFVCLRYAGRMRRASSTQTSFVVSVGVTAAIWSVLVHGGVDYIFHHSPQFAVMFFLLLALLRADQVQGELKTSQQQDAL